MDKRSTIYSVLFFMVISVLVFAGMRDSSSKLVPELRGREFFDEENSVSFDGRVLEVLKIKHPGEDRYGIHLKFESGDRQTNVHVGPSWYLEEIGLQLNEGDQITVEGALVEFRGESALIAASITKNGQEYTLRDPMGLPAWRGKGWER